MARKKKEPEASSAPTTPDPDVTRGTFIKKPPTTVTPEPVSPPAGEADSLAGVGPANSNQTYVTVTPVKGLKSLSAVELDAYIHSRALRCSKHVDGFRRRATELY